MKGKIDNPAKYRMEGRGIFILGTWFLVALLTTWWAQHHLTGRVLAYFLAILLSFPFVANIIVFGLYLREEKDEFERTVITQAMIWGIGGTLTATTFWGSLEWYGQAPHLGPFWVIIIFAVCNKVSQFFVRRSYR
jgi:hypothetical protein